MTKKKNIVEAPPERMPPIAAPVLPELIQQLRGEAPIEGELVDETTSAIAEYRPTAAALAGMREALAGKEWDLTTTKGNEEARQTRLVLVRLRTSLDTQRQQAINHITLWPARAAGKRAAEIAGFLQAASTESITTANFGPREPEAQAARAEAVNQLKAMHVAALASEEQAAKLQALEDEKLQAEATAQEAREKDARISEQIKGIRNLVNQANDNASSGEIGQYIDRLVAVRDGIPLGDTSVYGERTQEMHEAIEQTLNSLQVAAARALREEAVEAKRIQQEADDARMRIQNATLRDAVVAVLEWLDGDVSEGWHPGVPTDLEEMLRAALVNDDAHNNAKVPA